MAVTDSDDVFVARTQSAATTASSSREDLPLEVELLEDGLQDEVASREDVPSRPAGRE